MHGQHEFSETFKNDRALLLTRVWFSGVCRVGWPSYRRGDRSRFSCRGGLTLSYFCRFETGPNGSIRIGENCKINEHMRIPSYDSVIIGDNVPMASKIFISDYNHGSYCDKPSNPPVAPDNHPVISTVKIGGNVWIEGDTCMLVGIEMGRGLAASSAVVAHDVPGGHDCRGSAGEAYQAIRSESVQLNTFLRSAR